MRVQSSAGTRRRNSLVEFTEVARRDGVIIDARGALMFPHHHYTRGLRAADEFEPGRGAMGDRALIEERRANGWPRRRPLT